MSIAAAPDQGTRGRALRRGGGLLVLPAVLMLPVACIPVIPTVGPDLMDVSRQMYAELPQQELERDREVFLENCTGCHRLEAPHAWPAEEWPRIVDEMQQEVGFDDSAEERILRYILVARAWYYAEQDRRAAAKNE